MPRHIGWARVRRFALLGSESFDSYLHGIDSLSPQWNLQETTGSVAGAWNTAVALGRRLNLLTYGDYTAGAGWSNSGGQVALHTAGSVATFQQDGILAAGKTFQAKITISLTTAGSVTITDGGAAISGNGQATRTITSTGADFIITPTTDFDGSIDVAVTLVQQTNILASSQYAAPGDNPLDGADTATVVGVSTGIPAMPFARRFDGAASFIGFYSAELNSVFNPDAGTLIAVAKVANAGVWTDGIFRVVIRLQVDNDNLISLFKTSTNNQMQAQQTMGGTNKAIVSSLSDVDFFMLALTWDKSAAAGSGELKFFINGEQVGSTQTGLGTWVGNLDSTRTVIGATSTAPTLVWHGDIMENPLLGTRALTAGELLDIYQRSGI